MPRGVDGLTVEELRRGRDEWWSDAFTEVLAATLPVGARRVVEVGCGLGRLGRELLAHDGDLRYLGIDLDGARVRQARSGLPGAARAELLTARGEALPLGDGAVDAVLTVTTLMHVPDVGALLGEARRVTRPGGVIAAAEPDNLGQRWYFDGALDEVTQAFLEVSRAYRAVRLPADSCIGPRVASLLREAGLADVTVLVHAIQVSRREAAAESARRWRSILATMAGAAGLPDDAPLVRACDGALSRWLEAAGAARVGQSITTVPMFVTTGRVTA